MRSHPSPSSAARSGAPEAHRGLLTVQWDLLGIVRAMRRGACRDQESVRSRSALSPLTSLRTCSVHLLALQRAAHLDGRAYCPGPRRLQPRQSRTDRRRCLPDQHRVCGVRVEWFCWKDARWRQQRDRARLRTPNRLTRQWLLPGERTLHGGLQSLEAGQCPHFRQVVIAPRCALYTRPVYLARHPHSMQAEAQTLN